MKTLLLLNSGCGEPAYNMALDEVLLEAMPCVSSPVLRFYGWTEPAATFGYFQKHTEVSAATPLRPLIRRPTGGGLVPHAADWTYSLIFPAGHRWHLLRAEDSYRHVHEWIQAAFADLGLNTELAPCCNKTAPGQCFVGHEKFDLLWQGRKIAGAAQRRTKDGLLIQGSVQPPLPRLARSQWESAMPNCAAKFACAPAVNFVLPTALREAAERLACVKFSQVAYNQRR